MCRARDAGVKAADARIASSQAEVLRLQELLAAMERSVQDQMSGERNKNKELLAVKADSQHNSDSHAVLVKIMVCADSVREQACVQ